MSEREQNRRRESRPDKAPATVAVQDTEQESTIYQFLKKSREDSAEEKFIPTKLDMSSNQVADRHRDAAQQSNRPSLRKFPRSPQHSRIFFPLHTIATVINGMMQDNRCFIKEYAKEPFLNRRAAKALSHDTTRSPTCTKGMRVRT